MCRVDGDCPPQANTRRCLSSGALSPDDKICRPEKILQTGGLSTGVIIATVVLFVAAMLAAGAGVGGGSLFVPILVLCVPLAAKVAIPLSQVPPCPI